MKTLAKISQDRVLGGVCSGIGYAVGLPAWQVRIAFVLGLFLPGTLLVYLLLWAFMPAWPHDPTDYLARTNRMYEDGPQGPTPPSR